MKPIFTGTITALVTPFSDTGLDLTALSGLLDRQIAAGVGAVVLAGTTGESPTLTYEEYRVLVKFTKEYLRGRIPLIVGCGANCTCRACELASIAQSCGADGLLAVTPYYNKASARGIFLHYQALTRASSLPILVYNVPSRTGLALGMEHYRALAELPGIYGVKEASGDMELVEHLVRECGDRFAVYTGNDDQVVPAMRAGAAGVISVYANAAPGEAVRITDACSAGDFMRAEELYRGIRERVRSLFWEVNPIPVKYVLARRGECQPIWRLPLCPPSDATARHLKELWG